MSCIFFSDLPMPSSQNFLSRTEKNCESDVKIMGLGFFLVCGFACLLFKIHLGIFFSLLFAFG